ncbi:hypothetical protein CCHR01_18866 [Colletotrichum chrysophilum]|uniref:Uncharacterized protein n=1 Tax=Colletotrichum chrysophilum TaxID=1836956 RepID=A0AAD9A1L8_9PEZI|nr:hypothetical protein CCHR01_18866 [Colletotrichum chrysophilum]
MLRVEGPVFHTYLELHHKSEEAQQMDDSEKHRWHGHTCRGIDGPFPVELEACQVTFVALNLDLSNRGPKLELQPVCGLTSCVFPTPTLAPQS